jgi:hypothetical protein
VPIKPRSFFYPVLSPFSSDYATEVIFEADLKPKVLEEGNRNQVLIEYAITLTSVSLRDYVIDNRAGIAFDIYCADTMFRSLFKVSELAGELLLPAGSIKGKIEILPLIVVTNGSSPFVFEQISEEYPTTSFELEEGSLLALAPSVMITIEFAFSSSRDTIKIQLDSNCDKNSYYIDLTSDQIVIHMGENSHKAFEIYSNDQSQKPILFFSVYKDCIVTVLEALCKDASDISFNWAEHFLDQLEKRSIKLPKSDAAFSEINRTALQILGSRGFEKVTSNVGN